ncbi:hypothetical protein [Croceitalea rosinachiae]|uniref:Uncharacterized protein n=1 Tax=Croceitalea rosinachiae TaxID=3075596 RepID=A0ABU3AGV9_9FLAO|nr:hypothetical protein [Croceitalea sp. F388]MDT0608131.1 hypothetical protein [Croceitalea sp. F388]
MSEFFKAELKDKFLQYASDRDDYFETGLLYDEFLRPNYSIEFVEKLIKEIIDYDPNLIDIMSGNGVRIFMLSATAYTNEFIEEGGFKDLYVKEEEKWDTFLNQLSNTRRLSIEEKESLGETEKTSYKRERTLLYGLIGAVALSFLFTMFSLFKALFNDEKYVSQKEFEERIQKFENELNPKTEQSDSLLESPATNLRQVDSFSK